jgi:hypothetical protein
MLQHWHGIFQLDTNYVDGGAFVNQCPIVPQESFPYRFNARDQTVLIFPPLDDADDPFSRFSGYILVSQPLPGSIL